MKVSASAILLGLMASCNAAVLQRRQQDSHPKPALEGGDVFAGMAPPMQKALSIEELKPQINPAAKRLRVTYGPYKIKGKNDTSKVGNGKSGDPFGTAYNYLADNDLPRDITVLYTVSMPTIDKKSKISLDDGLYVHHTLYADMAHPNTKYLDCDQKGASTIPISVFMAGGLETGDFVFTNPGSEFKSGYYIDKNSKIMINVDIVNYKDEAKDLYMVSELEYLPGKMKGFKPAEHSTVNLGMCDGQNGLNIHPPKDQSKWTLKGSAITVTKDGWLMSSKGHLHDGGTNLKIIINDKEVCDSKAIYGGKGYDGKGADGKTWYTINKMTVCPNAIPIKKGDRIMIQAFYDTEKYPARQQAHGEMAEGMALFTNIYVPA